MILGDFNARTTKQKNKKNMYFTHAVKIYMNIYRN